MKKPEMTSLLEESVRRALKQVELPKQLANSLKLAAEEADRQRTHMVKPKGLFVFWRWLWMLTPVFAALAIFFFIVRPTQTTRPSVAPVAYVPSQPLVEQPRTPDLTTYLDSAERLLTQVNHASDHLDDDTRAQANELALANATYVEHAHQHGNLVQASVLESLAQTLIALDHEPPGPENGWHVRLEVDTEGLLLDIRILQQNITRSPR